MRSILTIYVFIALICNLFPCHARIGLSIFGLSVSKGNRPRVYRQDIEQPTLYDQYGSIPQVKNAYQAISKARPVVTLRTENSTIVAFKTDQTNLLRLFSGCKPLYLISSPLAHTQRHHILLTGVAGDCRMVVRFVKQLVLNHTAEFSASPTGHYIATNLGEYLQSCMSGTEAGRILAAHCFIISSPSSQKRETGLELAPAGSIYEITAVGGVSQISAGLAGGEVMQLGKQLLLDQYKLNMTAMDRKSMIESVFKTMLKAAAAEADDQMEAPSSLIDFQMFEFSDT